MKPGTVLHPGDRVLIVDKWQDNDHNHCGKMDHWLGQVMTVRGTTLHGSIIMEEDAGEFPASQHSGWFWRKSMIECVVETEEEPDISDVDGESMLDMLDM